MDRIAGYELRGVLGEGGMGTVYRAHDPTLDRPAAIKVIRAKALSPEGKDRFLREARACSRINHPNIITVYAAGEEDGMPYMAMELIDGRTLRDLIDEGGIDWRTATRWVINLLDALERLHADGIVHRDLKPENIMVTKDGIIKLMDFGLAHLTSSNTLTQEGTTLGTVPYMSPEQVLGRKVDARSDLFSLATIYHEMLTGQHPFRGEHPMAVMYSIRNETPKPLKLQSSDLPIGLQAVIDRAFEKEVDKRYQDAGAFREAILKAVPDLGGAAAPPEKVSFMRVALLIGGVAAVVFGIGLGGWSVWKKHHVAADHNAAVNLNELGQKLEDKGDIAGAEEKYREALIRDPEYAVSYNNLGFIALQHGDSTEADSLFHRALALSPGYTAPLILLGDVYFDSMPDSAEAFYRKALSGDDRFKAHNNLAALLIREGQYAAARDVIEDALRKQPEPDVRASLLKHRGVASGAMGDSASAWVDWREAARLQPNDPEIHRLAQLAH